MSECAPRPDAAWEAVRTADEYARLWPLWLRLVVCLLRLHEVRARMRAVARAHACAGFNRDALAWLETESDARRLPCPTTPTVLMY